MDNRIATLKRRTQRFRLGQVANDRLPANTFKIFQIACFANQNPKVSTLGRQCKRYMMADKSGSACEEDFHKPVVSGQFSVVNSRTCTTTVGDPTKNSACEGKSDTAISPN
jgi:hypothetical protein